jgi:outer membrane protein assembly factor BamE (lipoprotein component of BamABCDE complex)
MLATNRINRSTLAASLSMLIAAGAIAAAPISQAHADETLPKFSIHVQAPRVTDETIQKIQPGMSEGDVEGLIGSPVRTMRFPLSNTVAWDYDFNDTWGYRSVFSVTFNDGGSVQSKIAIRTPY